MPRVSVIIPTYNRADFLKNAISSVLQQSYTDFEIIVSDDRSTDHTHALVTSLNDNRIKYIKNSGNKGPSAARNHAILASTGKYIAFLDDDDEWLPEKLEKQISVLERSNKNICGIHSGIIAIDRRSDKIIVEEPRTKMLRGNLLYVLGVCNPIKTTTLVVKRKCLDKIGLFDETLSYGEDWDLLIRLSKNWDIEYIYEPLVKYFYHDRGQLTGSISGQISGKEVLFNRYPEIFRRNKIRWSEYLLGVGAQYCQINNITQGRLYILKSIRNYPFNLFAYIHFFSSFLSDHKRNKLKNFYKMKIKKN